ncbi:hypothetical protein DWG18_07765 [Lysobacter sp. TY2-98]|nr:hypothetical protein DWG18_07765 [Lysobacter sp. TY2-98]
MNRRARFSGATFAAVMAATSASAGARVERAASPAANSWLLPADTVVEGASFGEWTGRWWNWALSQPIEPFLDPDGRICDRGQDGPVWYLAGTDGSFDAHRECVVPEGKYLLIPIINMVQMRVPATAHLSSAACEGLRRSAAVNNDNLASAVVLVDGVKVPDVTAFRVRSGRCFELAARNANAAADGYWLFLRPLPRGRHVITVGANYDSGRDRGYGTMVQNFEYVVHVGGRTNLTSL